MRIIYRIAFDRRLGWGYNNLWKRFPGLTRATKAKGSTTKNKRANHWQLTRVFQEMTVKKFLYVVFWTWSIAVCSALLLLLLHWPSGTVVATCQQPSSLQYDGRGPYCLSIVERDIDWLHLPPRRKYRIYAGRDSGTADYGHWIDFSFHTVEDLASFLGKPEATWTAEGVELDLESGHRLYIPADMFTGGR